MSVSSLNEVASDQTNGSRIAAETSASVANVRTRRSCVLLVFALSLLQIRYFNRRLVQY